MTKYEVTQFNKRRLMRGEKYCYRTNIYEDGKLVEWVWLKKEDFKEIEKDEDCTLCLKALENK